MKLLLILFSLTSLASFEWGSLQFSYPENEKILEIVRPARSYKVLLEWKDENEFNCIIYQLPSAGKSNGVLYSGRRSLKGCSLAKRRTDQALRENIKNLKVKLTRGKMGSSYQVILKDKNDSETVLKWQFPFGQERFKRWRGFDLSIEKLDQSKGLASGKVCSFFDTDTLKVNYQNCSQCLESQWTPVLNRLSSSYPIAICGVRNCGERNQNPCLKMTSLKGKVSCEEAKELVFCQSGRVLICLNSGFLQCR